MKQISRFYSSQEYEILSLAFRIKTSDEIQTELVLGITTPDMNSNKIDTIATTSTNEDNNKNDVDNNNNNNDNEVEHITEDSTTDAATQ